MKTPSRVCTLFVGLFTGRRDDPDRTNFVFGSKGYEMGRDRLPVAEEMIGGEFPSRAILTETFPGDFPVSLSWEYERNLSKCA